MQVAEIQRARMLSSAVQVVSEHGYQKMSVARVAGGARVSRRTFYEVFTDREDCFLAAFEEAVARVEGLLLGAYASASARPRPERIRAALLALLVFLEEEPGVGSLLIVDALTAGPRVVGRRVEVLQRLSEALDRESARSQSARELPALTGEGVVGAVFSVIHTRLLAERPAALTGLLNPLMAMIVLPYLGAAASQKELGRPVPKPARGLGARRRSNGDSSSWAKDPLADVPIRLTYRTLRVLAAIGERSGASNRQVADAAGITDQGQISKLLARLERLGLVANTGEGHLSGERNAWLLTARGAEVQQAIQARSKRADNQGEVSL
jgi:AcrR family transcriptional regulator/DNA-binding MarR family transcriptional regulator